MAISRRGRGKSEKIEKVEKRDSKSDRRAKPEATSARESARAKRDARAPDDDEPEAGESGRSSSQDRKRSEAGTTLAKLRGDLVRLREHLQKMTDDAGGGDDGDERSPLQRAFDRAKKAEARAKQLAQEIMAIERGDAVPAPAPSASARTEAAAPTPTAKDSARRGPALPPPIVRPSVGGDGDDVVEPTLILDPEANAFAAEPPPMPDKPPRPEFVKGTQVLSTPQEAVWQEAASAVVERKGRPSQKGMPPVKERKAITMSDLESDEVVPLAVEPKGPAKKAGSDDDLDLVGVEGLDLDDDNLELDIDALLKEGDD